MTETPVAETLRSIRREAALSQAALAKVCHIPLNTYSSWERGIRECADYIPYLIRQLLIKERYIHD